MSIIPQYLKTTDPDTVAAVKADHDDREALLARIIEFRDKNGAARARIWNEGMIAIARLEWDGPRPDGWKKDGTPYRNNTDACAEFRSLRHTDRKIPGMPGRFLLSSGHRDGRGLIIRPATVEHDGVAYASLSRVIDTELVTGGIEIGDQWVECLSSEYAAARKAVMP